MSFEPLVSVVVPIYNMGGRVRRCVLSIIAQTYGKLEIILVDDGSSDDSLEVCTELKEEDSRIKVFHTENRGSGPARNFGIQQARGEYVVFPDADDELVFDALEKMVCALEEGKQDLVIAGFELIDQDGNLQKKQCYSGEVHSGDNIRHAFSQYVGSKSRCPINGAPWIKLFNLQLIRQFEIEYPPLRRHQDTAFVVRYLSHTNSVMFLNDVLYRHYTNDIRLVWEKYPVNYIDICYDLHQIMLQTVLAWNPEDKDTIEVVSIGYITRVVKAIELTFSPKQKLNGKERLQWLRSVDEKYGLSKLHIPDSMDFYHKHVLRLLSKGKLRSVLHYCRMKVMVEKKGYLDRIKKVIRGGKCETNRNG